MIGRACELRRGDRALTGRRRDADQVLGRILCVSDVAERRHARDDDVGVEGEREHRVNRRRLAGRDCQCSSQHGEVDQAKGQLATAGRDASKRNAPV